MNEARASILDMGTIDTLLDMLGDEIHEIFADFVSHAPTQIEQLRQAAVAGDTPAMMQLAHSLKGMSGNIGASALYHQCQQLELQAKADKVENGEAQIARIQATFEQTSVHLLGLQEKSS